MKLIEERDEINSKIQNLRTNILYLEREKLVIEK